MKYVEICYSFRIFITQHFLYIAHFFYLQKYQISALVQKYIVQIDSHIVHSESNIVYFNSHIVHFTDIQQYNKTEFLLAFIM